MHVITRHQLLSNDVWSVNAPPDGPWEPVTMSAPTNQNIYILWRHVGNDSSPYRREPEDPIPAKVRP